MTKDRGAAPITNKTNKNQTAWPHNICTISNNRYQTSGYAKNKSNSSVVEDIVFVLGLEFPQYYLSFTSTNAPTTTAANNTYYNYYSSSLSFSIVCDSY